MSRSITFEVPGPPVPSQRAGGASKNGKVWRYTPKRSREFKKLVSFLALQHFKQPTDQEVALRVQFYVPNLVHRDLDNLVKSVKDALNSIAYHDDSQVVLEILVKRLDREHPRTVVTVRTIGAGPFSVKVSR